jgi:hypothetical protein
VSRFGCQGGDATNEVADAGGSPASGRFGLASSELIRHVGIAALIIWRMQSRAPVGASELMGDNQNRLPKTEELGLLVRCVAWIRSSRTFTRFACDSIWRQHAEYLVSGD